jgi:competence protein ComEA
MQGIDTNQRKILLFMAAVFVLLLGVYVFKDIIVDGKQSVVAYKGGEMVLSAGGGGNGSVLQNSVNNVNDEEQPPRKIKVYIIGEVKSPGVIEVQEGSRLADVIELAGGVSEEADLKRVNLAMKVHDEGMYEVPKIGEELTIQNGQTLTGLYDQARQKININTANEALLETLPGIGPSKAKSIIEYRSQNGPFKSIEEIKNVSGIGNKTFEQIKDLIAVK